LVSQVKCREVGVWETTEGSLLSEPGKIATHSPANYLKPPAFNFSPPCHIHLVEFLREVHATYLWQEQQKRELGFLHFNNLISLTLR